RSPDHLLLVVSMSHLHSVYSRHKPLHTPPPYSLLFFFQPSVDPLALHSFPTRRSSDLPHLDLEGTGLQDSRNLIDARDDLRGVEDRKSTRLNSSHDQISYAVFCLKKKKILNFRWSADGRSRCILRDRTDSDVVVIRES